MKNRNYLLLFIFSFIILLLLQTKQLLSQYSVEEARREYNQALEEYEKAKADYNITDTLDDITDLSWSGKKAGPFVHTYTKMDRENARRKVEIAKERLDTAKTRLWILESKSNSYEPSNINTDNNPNTSTSSTNNNDSSFCSNIFWITVGTLCLLALIL